MWSQPSRIVARYQEDKPDNLLDAQVNVLLDAEAKVSVLREVLPPQLILLHLEASLQDLLSLNNSRVRGQPRGTNVRSNACSVCIISIWEF